MSSNYYLGTSPDEVLGNSPRYFYGLRRNEDGELFFVRSDQLKDTDDVILNNPGSISGTFEDFEAGVDFLDGITIDHEIEYEDLKYPQYKWDGRAIFYYIDANGQLTMRINRNYTYPTGISSNG
jgi:hypothetical protein